MLILEGLHSATAGKWAGVSLRADSVKISKEFYGEASKYMRIFEANRDQLNDPNLIKVGQVLKIPQD